jgi:hypothetical protein
MQDIKKTLFLLLSEAEEISEIAEHECRYIRALEKNFEGNELKSDWCGFREKYEKWYRGCIGLMKSNVFSGLDDFQELYYDDEESLPSIRKAILRGFTISNYFGFTDRFNSQVAILASLEQEFEHRQKSLVMQSPNPLHLIPYIHATRIEELRSIKSHQFDLTKLIKLCEELNQCYDAQCFFAVTMLARAVIDHIPPIFGCIEFTEVANNYGGKTACKSFKKSMQNLRNSMKNIADSHLHDRIRSKETLPNQTQVNFSNDFDILLAEVVRILR